MTMFKKYRLLLLVILLIGNHIGVDGNICKKSLETLRIVETCPSTKSEWESAAQRKNCEFHARNQSCSEPSKFKYHCVSNVFFNETMEVCAPERKIIGHCPEFNTQGATIQNNYDRALKCNNLSQGCPIFLSTDTYLYSDCYPDRITTTKENFNLSNTTESQNSILVLVLSVVFAVFFLLAIAGFIFLIRKRRQKNGRIKRKLGKTCWQKNNRRKTNKSSVIRKEKFHQMSTVEDKNTCFTKTTYKKTRVEKS
ncbi:uncharacterized protein LOC134256308 [Saccostrea cucullata]|uniref:uncharacterized protein LOC134256308 n=1 Tax=Saccostrea cuccullata TaxID=36930 RepID=UPI002ED23F71